MFPAVYINSSALPSLRSYVTSSILLLLCSVILAAHYSVTSLESLSNKTLTSYNEDHKLQMVRFVLTDIFTIMVQLPMCVVILVNFFLCLLCALGKLVQKLVFGEFRVSEQQHVKVTLSNFVFYKFIFIFGVMNVQTVDEGLLWFSWLSVIGFLTLFAKLCKYRFEYLSFSPTIPQRSHVRLLGLLFTILVLSCCTQVAAIYIAFPAGWNTVGFLSSEWLLLSLLTLYVIVRYVIHLVDLRKPDKWEKRDVYVYYVELVFELTTSVIEFLHHIHMLIWGNMFFSMASIIISMQLRYFFIKMQRTIEKHNNYLRVVKQIEKYPYVSPEDLKEESEDCAICWDKLECARKLPCNHYFHSSCLRSWLEQDPSCPICRKSLDNVGKPDSSSQPGLDDGANSGLGIMFNNTLFPNTQGDHITRNHSFHFNGLRYVSWLPSFSVEVTHTQLARPNNQQVNNNSLLDNMVRQVQEMFPDMPAQTVRDDLRNTRSVEVTIENILEQRLIAPPAPRYVVPGHQDASGATAAATSHSKADDSPQLNGASHGVDENAKGAALTDDKAESQPLNLGGRFSKVPQEREQALRQRRDALLSNARRRYLAKQVTSCENTKQSLE